MPLPNEHSCRLAEPEEFEPGSFRRTHLGSGIDAIMGKKKGASTMTMQAMRFPTDKFSADEARAHCTKHDGSFTAAGESD